MGLYCYCLKVSQSPSRWQVRFGVEEHSIDLIGRTEAEAQAYEAKGIGAVPSHFADRPDSYAMRTLAGLYEETGNARYLPISMGTTFNVVNHEGNRAPYTVPKARVETLYMYYDEEQELLLDDLDMLELEEMDAGERATKVQQMITTAKLRAQKAFWADDGAR